MKNPKGINNKKRSGYYSWHCAKRRCTDPTNHNYDNYGGRGITMDPAWVVSSHAFFADMGESPGMNYSLDRIDNDKGYYKENCRWATKEEQQRNKKNNVRYDEFDGITLPEIAELFGFRGKKGRNRLKRRKQSEYDIVELLLGFKMKEEPAYA